MEILYVDAEDGLSYPMVIVGPLQLWLVPDPLPTFDGLSDRTTATWIYDDGHGEFRVLRGFRSPGA